MANPNNQRPSDDRRALQTKHHTQQASPVKALDYEQACKEAAQKAFDLAADLRNFAPGQAASAQYISDLLTAALGKAGKPDDRKAAVDRQPFRAVTRFVPPGSDPKAAKLPIRSGGSSNPLQAFAPDPAKDLKEDK